MADVPVVIDEFVDDDDAYDDDSHPSSSSGSSVEILTESQLCDPDSVMQVVNPIDGFVLVDRRRGPFILDSPKNDA